MRTTSWLSVAMQWRRRGLYESGRANSIIFYHHTFPSLFNWPPHKMSPLGVHDLCTSTFFSAGILNVTSGKGGKGVIPAGVSLRRAANRVQCKYSGPKLPGAKQPCVCACVGGPPVINAQRCRQPATNAGGGDQISSFVSPHRPLLQVNTS